MEASNLNAEADSSRSSSSAPPSPPLDEKLQKSLDKFLYAGGNPAAQNPPFKRPGLAPNAVPAGRPMQPAY